ncbi:MAG: NAD(P)H-hydrate dehydratase [Ruminococcaceae bacterium]|nr:NAD(P)H-hydrate dehydratase [Oscillospiraceae bacterium]
MRIYTASEIRLVEERENEIGTRFIRLMENAGSACAKYLERYKGKFCVICGKGKNGGDGFVISRKLHEAGFDVTAVLAFGEPTAPDAIEMLNRARTAGVEIVRHNIDLCIRSADIIVDCMFGIGFHGTPDETIASVFEMINSTFSFVVAIDVPSGVDTDTGMVDTCVCANVTLAITCLKPAHVLLPAKSFCGEIEVLEIGISEEALDYIEHSYTTLCDEEVGAILEVRDDFAHKHNFGSVLVVAGSRNMPGAACLASKAAVVTGAGLTTVAFPASAYPALAAHAPEVMLCPVKEDESGKLASRTPLLEYVEKANVLVIGPGLGRSENITSIVCSLLKAAKCPVVLDADGLNAIVDCIDILKECSDVIVTPHMGEMKRLGGLSAVEFATQYGVTVLLKGPVTEVASSAKIYLNSSGNVALAKGGSGDVLSGMIGGLLAQGLSSFDAASVGAYIHGRAADIMSKERGVASMLPSDLFAGISKFYMSINR